MFATCRVDHPDCLLGLPPGCRCGIAWRAEKAAALPATPTLVEAAAVKRRVKR